MLYGVDVWYDSHVIDTVDRKHNNSTYTADGTHRSTYTLLQDTACSPTYTAVQTDVVVAIMMLVVVVIVASPAGIVASSSNRARQLYKNIYMLFLFPVKDGKRQCNI